MIKFGITQRGPAAQQALQLEQQHRGWWPFAYTLLEAPAEDYCADDEPLLTRLYESLGAGEGVYKITRSERLGELDELLLADAKTRFADADPLVIHDMAASNGITSLNLYEHARQQRPVIVHATDYFDRLTLVTLPHSDWTVAFDALDKPLQISSRRFVVSASRREPLRYPFNRLVQQWAWSRVIPAARSILRQPEARRPAGVHVRTLPLFHPRCLQTAQHEETFLLGRHSVYDPNPIPCHIVRAMNYLTARHVDVEQLPAAIRACLHNLTEDGLLLLGRTVDEGDGRIRATAYVRDQNRLRTAWSLNDGYECADVVESLKLDQSEMDEIQTQR